METITPSNRVSCQEKVVLLTSEQEQAKGMIDTKKINRQYGNSLSI